MKADFSRSTFNPLKHYRGVLMQQGRVQLDADWNENLDILLHRIETETIDVIGECGVPEDFPAFGVAAQFSDLSLEDQAWLNESGKTTPLTTSPGVLLPLKGLDLTLIAPGDFYLSSGRAYVDGLMLEVERPTLFSQQPFVLPAGRGQIQDRGIYLLYLDVWNRHVTALEDPSIREVALGGPDTTTRMQTVWQAKLARVGELGENISCANRLLPWPAKSTGRLQARTTPVPPPEGPCSVPPESGYTRLENQLYRVEIHKDSHAAGGPTFKWSRDNGSVVVAATEFPVDGSSTKIRTASLGRDDVLGLHALDWVEVLDDATELAGIPGVLAQITLIETGNILTLAPSTDLSGFTLNDPAGNPTHLKVRRWDVSVPQNPAETSLAEGTYLPLEGGVEIQFKTGGTYHTGDYWLIPARTVPGQYGDIEWPKAGSDPAALLARGIEHHYCKLAVLTAELSTKEKITITHVDDCRKKFPALTELPTSGNCCCTVSVGQGGDFPDLQTAIDARPENATVWRICVLAGAYPLPKTITSENITGLTISGCGQQTPITGPAGEPAFGFANAQDVRLENLWINASSPTGAIVFTASTGVVVSNCTVMNHLPDNSTGTTVNKELLVNATVAASSSNPGPGIVVLKGSQVEILDNTVSGYPALRVEGQWLSILRNRLTAGGLQIVPPSTTVLIEDNTIFKGRWSGDPIGQ